MSDADKVFAGSIPENYDRYLVPLIFERYAVDLAQRAASLSPHTVLETAAGRWCRNSRIDSRGCRRAQIIS